MHFQEDSIHLLFTSLAHGCSGKGNDQVRFDITLRSGSDLPIIAPIRDKNLDRDTELKFANKHGIEIDSVAKKFSIDQNLWGRAIEGGVLEDPYNEPPDDAFIWVKTKDLPDKPTYLEIKFDKGVPIEVDGLWQDPLKTDLDGFIEKSQNPVSGTVKLKLYKGSLRVVGRKSKNSLYSHEIATYGVESTFDQRLAKGFVELWGIQSTEANKLQKKRKSKT